MSNTTSNPPVHPLPTGLAGLAAGAPQSGWKAWARCLGPCVGVALALFFIGEKYPFSDFPMYARLGADRWLVELTDGEGKTIPTVKAYFIPTSNLKKIVDKNLRAKKTGKGAKKAALPMKAWQESGQQALSYLAERVERHRAQTGSSEPAGPWQLWKRTFNYDDSGKVVSERVLLATWPSSEKGEKRGK